MWESRRPGKEQRALVAESIEEEQGSEYEVDDDDELEEPDDEETQEALVAFQNAKSRYQSILKSRGTTVPSSGSKEDRLRLAKARSYCSACKKKGHWHKDPICPLHPSNRKDGIKETQTAHMVYFTDMIDDGRKLHAIADSACSRTLAGTGWLMRYRQLADECGVPTWSWRRRRLSSSGARSYILRRGHWWHGSTSRGAGSWSRSRRSRPRCPCC